MALTGSLRVGFLLPSLLAGIGTVLLVYDLLRRVHGREAALAGALMLLFTCQFAWQARQAQIDATLCFLTTASLYGLLRHLLIAPAPGWFLAGWAAAGLGVITKGVGFLPLLVLIPIGVLATRGWPVAARSARVLWIAGPVAALAAVALWLVPMWFATSAGAELQGYRDEILLHQTLTRYGAAWHHREPAWYYLTNVIPWLWLPLIALLPWLWPRWRRSLAGRDTLTAALVAWVLIVIAFFSASTGKRGVYVLPALPALAMAAAPWLPELLRARGPRRLALTLVALVTLVSGALGRILRARGDAGTERCRAGRRRTRRPARCGRPWRALPMLAAFRLRDAWLGWMGTLAAVMIVTGFMIPPRIDASRSGRAFMQIVARSAADVPELGFVDLREQFALQLRRPIVHFGREAWREPEREAANAARWLDEDPRQGAGRECPGARGVLRAERAEPLGHWHRRDWFLVRGPANPACVDRGNASAARHYAPPEGALNTGS